MRYVTAVAMIPFGMVLTLASLPWILLGFAAKLGGDNELGDRILDHAPLGLWLDWVER